jgi:hypothetical protein
MPDLLAYLANSLAWSAFWLIFGYVAMTTYITKGHM